MVWLFLLNRDIIEQTNYVKTLQFERLPMSIAILVFQKLVVLFLLMAIGYLLMVRKIFNHEVTLHLSKFLTTLVAPSLFVASFIKADFSLSRLGLLALMIVMALLVLASRILLLRFLLPKERTLDRYAVLFANVGFMGTPLALAVGGAEAVFYISGFVVVNQMMQWTYGIYLITKDPSRVSFRAALINPAAISTAIGLMIFILPITIPSVLVDTIDSFSQLNTPLSTIVLGTYFYKANWRDIFTYKPAYWTAFLRLLVTSIFSILMIWLLPIQAPALKLALTIASCSPTALNLALLSQVYGGDYQYGSRLILLTTSFSLVTIPLMMGLASLLYL